MYCKYCGSNIKGDENYCNKCGKKLDNSLSESYSPSLRITKKKELKNGHRTGAIIIIVLILIIGLWFFQQLRQREALQNVQIDIDNIGVKSIGFSGLTLDIGLRMYNPNDVTATLDRIDYSIYGNAKYVGNGIINQRLDIPPRESRITNTELRISYSGALNVIWSALQKGDVNWRITGTAHFDTPLGTIDIPFDK